MSIAETFLDFMDFWITVKKIAKDQNIQKSLDNSLIGWSKYFSSICKTSPAIKQLYEEHKDWWVEEIGEIMGEKVIV